MDDNHSLATPESATKILEAWGPHYDESCSYFLEKSPPNLIRTRFLQKLFPNSRLVVILRHPAAVAFATRKWNHASAQSLIEHALRGYEILASDLPYLKTAYGLRYEDMARSPQLEIDRLLRSFSLPEMIVEQSVWPDVNVRYFEQWRQEKGLFPGTDSMEARANRFGYSTKNCDELFDSEILGLHCRAAAE